MILCKVLYDNNAASIRVQHIGMVVTKHGIIKAKLERHNTARALGTLVGIMNNLDYDFE